MSKPMSGKPPVDVVLGQFPRALFAVAEYVQQKSDDHGGMFGGRLRPGGAPMDEWRGSLARHAVQTCAGQTDEPHDVALAFNALGYLESRLRTEERRKEPLV